MSEEQPCPLIKSLYERLLGVKRMSFDARSKTGSQTGWDGHGEAEVCVKAQGHATQGSLWLIERGYYHGTAITPIRFSNTFRLEFSPCRVGFFHERFGHENAVWLFDMVSGGNGLLASDEPHQCAKDRYAVTLALRPDAVEMCWAITGPRKNEHIRYSYFV